MAVHMRYISWYICLPSSAKQQRENYIVWGTWTTVANFLTFYFKLIAVFQIQFRDNFDSD